MDKPIFIPKRVREIVERKLSYEKTLTLLNDRCDWLFKEKGYIKRAGGYAGEEKEEWRDTLYFIKWYNLDNACNNENK